MHQPMMQSVQIRIILMVTLLAWIRSNYRDTGSEPRYHSSRGEKLALTSILVVQLVHSIAGSGHGRTIGHSATA